MSISEGPHAVHYLPIATTILSIPFAWALLRRFRARGGLHLLWWGIGVVCYGLGTLLESVITLHGNTFFLNKAWYVAGALLGGYPLAQGSVYLHLSRRKANLMTALTLPVVLVASVLVLLSPVDASAFEPHRPGGAILAWRELRLLTPLVNGYAALFLIGGAAYSAWTYASRRAGRARAVGNALIALGALLPGIGGGFAKAGVVEALYVGELAGLVLIWSGYTACIRGPSPAPAVAA